VSATKWLRNDPNRPFPTDLSQIQAAAAKVFWPTHEPVWFYRNRGNADAKALQRALNYQTPQNVALMAATGIQMPLRAHFFKGAGLQRERSSIEKTIQYSRLLHDQGMLISVYVGGTMFTDYFFKEVPEAVNWVRKDQDSNPVTYGSYQLQRWFPCLNNPGYRAYTRNVLDVAVQEIQADEIFFDNQILRHEPRSCRCDYCIRHLRDMIGRKYTLEQCLERYGFAEYPDVVPPIFSQACKPWRLDRVCTPQIQDWIDHRVATVIEFYQEMADHVKKQRPATAVGMNIKGIHGHNHAFDHGICHGSFSDILDYSCIDGYNPGVHDGAVVSEVRFWKSSHSTHIAVVDEPGEELPAAEGQVYGYRKLIEGHGWLGGIGDCSAFTPMTQFLRANQRLFHERRRLQDVAVLRTQPSTNYNCAKVHEQLMAFEQSLAVEKIPWGIIFDGQIDALATHRIVALPEMQAISDLWLERLDAFMRAGGGVIASGKTAQFDHWYRQREAACGLARWLGCQPGNDYAKAKVGKGCLVYVPTWDVGVKWDFNDWFMASRPQPVLNRRDFLRAVTDASQGRPLTHRVTGNNHVFAESIAADGGVDVHFINYNQQNTKPVMSVQIAAPAGARKVQVTLTDPHQAKPKVKKVPATLKSGVIAFKMFTPRVYGLAQARFS